MIQDDCQVTLREGEGTKEAAVVVVVSVDRPWSPSDGTRINIRPKSK
jgi:hypothetical protein